MKRAMILGVLACLSGRLAVAADVTVPATKPAANEPTTKPAADPTILAYLGDKAVTAGEIDQFIRRPTSGPAIPDDVLQRQRQQGLSQYLMRMLFESYAADHPELVTDAEIDATVKKYEERVAASGRKLEDALKQFGMTMADFRKRLIPEVVGNQLMEKAADDKAAEAFYEKHKSDFDGTQFTAKHILILVDPFFGTPEDQEKAKATLETVKKEIQSGKMTFDEAISKYSEDPGRGQGPTLPPFARYGMMVEPFAAAAAALKPGEISDPVKTNFGYHLIQLVSREPGKAQTFDQAKDAIKNFLGSQARDKMVEEQRAKHPIKMLMAYVKPPRRELPPRPATQPTTQANRPSPEAQRRMIEQIRQRQAQMQSTRPAAAPAAVRPPSKAPAKD